MPRLRRTALATLLASLFILLALVAGVVPAAAVAPSAVSGGGRQAPPNAAVQVQALAADLRAAGWIVTSTHVTPDHRDNQVAPNSAAADPISWHTDGSVTAATPEFPHANGRYYRIWGQAFIHHSSDEGNQWRARFDTVCQRRYGTNRVDNPCDWYVGIFQALGFTLGSGGSTNIHGSANIPNTTCDYGSGGTSAWRVVDSTYPWKMSYQTAIWVDFKDDNCTTDLHTSQTRSLGSYRAKVTGTEAQNNDPDRSGWKGL